MGRSKFPGKPSKHVNRKRINVLPPSSEGKVESSEPMTVETVAENKQPENDVEEKRENVKSVNTKVSLRRRLNRKIQGSKALLSNNSTKRGLISKLCNKNNVKLNKFNRKPVHAYSPMKNYKLTKESNNLVGKFVLPTRSVHSSRVIKPNKRFINVDLSDTVTLKKRVINKRHLKASESPKPSDDTSEPSFSNGRVVLRQARLKLHNQTPKGSEGPFSSTSSSGSPPRTVTCGVCGAVRFYRFVKQARKFNIYSCESCRKFISKMIKRQSCGKNTSSLVCHKGQGMCHVPPIVRSQQMKLIRCAYRSRCPACWLKMCLRSFQMPLSLKNSLIQLLPKNMQNSDVAFNSLLWQVSVQNIEPKSDEPVHQRPVRLKNTKPVQQQAPTEIKRQKIDLKGPRVKHVCRSASIVLGQPLATFSPEADKKDEKKKKSEVSDSENDSNESKRERIHRVPSSVSSASSVSSFSSNLSTYISTIVPRNKTLEKKPPTPQEMQNMISIDYWDNCDNLDQNGFCLISSQQFPMPAICFLCGSAGRETLLHCSLCCEPYHPYCLERSPPVSTNKQVPWFCPKCTTCNTCNQPGRRKKTCQKCHKAYHFECFKTVDNAPSQLVCLSCLRCKDCRTTNSKFYGNIPLCLSCLKLRIKGSTCPVCLIFVDSYKKIVECTKCKKWLHAECENLSEEYYYILSYLPESVKYLCLVCSKQTSSSWCKAVETELKFNLNKILRILSRNKSKLSDETEIETKSQVVSIKRKLSEYRTVKAFNSEMEEALAQSELASIYRTTLKTVFPWFNSQSVDSNLIASPKRLSNEEDFEQIEFGSIDSRYCSFCKSIGDGLSHLESRLLYCGQNEWVHINCALWSSEVYEEIDGCLQNVHAALVRSRLMRCSYCKQKGASVGCCQRNCAEIYHFLCARTAKCHFTHDKTVFCCSHEAPSSGIIDTPTDFNIRRSVFVANKTGQFGLIDKINVMVGSLCVNNLGKISHLSDTVDAIIPTGYNCSRLFWSTVEPWKMVNYKISTSVLNAQVNNLQLEKSFTVDHSLSKSVVERKLKEILLWHKEIDKKKVDIIEFEDDEEPQNGADLLSPEITDALFEELPHEILDGISVQDIFPKLMSYEDLLNMENSDSNTDKKEDEEEDLKAKRCNLTLSCKLDNSFSPVMKKRKITPRDNMFFQILQVDGNFDDSDSESHVYDDEEPVTCERCQCTYRTQASYKRHLETCEIMCSSESDSELNQEQEEEPEIPQVVITSYESYQNQIHTSINTQTFVKSSEVILPQEVVVPESNEVYTTTVNDQFCLNPVSLCVNPVQTVINQPQLEFQQPVIQSIPYNNIINIPTTNQNILNSVLTQNRWVKPVETPKSPKVYKKTRTIAAKRDDEVIAPVLVQPFNSFVPLVDQTAQNVQYVTTAIPQQPLVQLDSNVISVIPGIQPMIIQPRVLENQLIVDNTLWQQQVQPVYYGFETIVQNTVMQSQQFLPSTVPGVLTANSSYSTTTQVFQTSKLEPVIDVSANSFVLVNTGVVNQVEVPQFHKPPQPVATAQFVPEPTTTIPTNIVTPTPKPITTQSRPMSRVLPMPTIKEVKEIKPEPLPVVEFEKKIEKELVIEKKEPKVIFKDEPKPKLNNTVQIAPLKPIKTVQPKQILAISDKQNRPEKEKKIEPPKVLKEEKKENEPSILYTIETQDGFKYSSTSISDLWSKVFEAVQNARAAHNMPLLPSESVNIVNSLQVLGLKSSGLKYLIEQLPGATKCNKYRPSFSFPSKFHEIEEDLVGHLNGCARCAPHVKRDEPYDMFGWLASKHRKPEQNSLFCSDLVPRRGSVNNLPMAMRFRQLKLTSKYSVGVYRSKIHRRGLFCLRDFEAGEMVIEYSGEVIRSVLTDQREKYYNSKGIGCYMFRIDDNLVVDATMRGNAARFINHSCDPNCYSKVVEILGHKHIIIFALRRIICGEELTYDYKFPIEEDKIPCTCGTRRCRKFLN